MPTKSSQLQIRVSPAEKKEIQRLAQAEKIDISSWVLKRLLAPARFRFQQILDSEADQRFILAELNDFFTGLAPTTFESAVEFKPLKSFGKETDNYIAAMIEVCAKQKNVSVPKWVQAIPPLKTPVFASDLKNLRLHLLLSSLLRLGGAIYLLIRQLGRGYESQQRED